RVYRTRPSLLLPNCCSNQGSEAMLNISNCGHHDRAPSNVDLLNRLSAALDNAHLDCGCRPQLDEVLARFEKRERLQDARACLANARTQREKLEIALLFLNDLDDLT